MKKGKESIRRKRYRSDWKGNLRQILKPEAWKKIHRAAGDYEEGRSRWKLQPLIHVGLTMALDSSPTISERFEVACEADARMRPHGRRCGQKQEGYTRALAEVPLEVFGAVRGVLQESWKSVGVSPAQVGRWEAYALDGSKQNLPRTDANEAGFGIGTKEPAMPQGLTVAAVAMGQRVLWDWESASSLDSERDLALRILRRLPPQALGVLDAGFVGYEWIREVLAAGKHVLMRVGANVRLWTEKIGGAQERGGVVWLWPDDRRKEAPVKLRLIKIVRVKRKRIKKRAHSRRAWSKTRQVIWLLTDIEDEEALTDREAGELFGLRWGGNEIRFRDWKCTLSCATVLSRTPEQARRETALSLSAAMLLHIMAARARRARCMSARPVSVAQAVRAWRRAVRKIMQEKSTAWFGKHLSNAVVDTYARKRPKVKRRWPQRKDHRLPGTPKFRKLVRRIKVLGLKRLEKKCA